MGSAHTCLASTAPLIRAEFVVSMVSTRGFDGEKFSSPSEWSPKVEESLWLAWLQDIRQPAATRTAGRSTCIVVVGGGDGGVTCFYYLSLWMEPTHEAILWLRRWLRGDEPGGAKLKPTCEPSATSSWTRPLRAEDVRATRWERSRADILLDTRHQ